MGIKEALGLKSDQKVRYAIVGVGDIAQEALMPGVAHTGNSVITALVTGDPRKASELGKRYEVKATYPYGEFAAALRSGTFDAIYLATPNWRHAEFIVPALEAGIHVLVEKPLEVNTEQCRKILAAERAAYEGGSGARLMVAYRLHFESATLDTIEQIRAGRFGQVHTFSSTFAQPLDPRNHRAHSGDRAGPVLDMGPYPVNAARYIFSAEPIEVVSAVGTRHAESGFDQDFYDTVAVTLRFDQDRLAQFSCSYYGGPLSLMTVMGPEGAVVLDPAFQWGKPIEQTLVNGTQKEKNTFKPTDHFGGELKYFSDCILNHKEIEPDGEEGFADVRVLEGILQALKSGKSVELPPFTRKKRISTEAQKETLRALRVPDPVDVKSPARIVQKEEKN